MKKLSNVSNSPINKAKELNEERNINPLKSIVYDLIEEFLTIKFYGPINPILQGSFFIEGKEIFTDALCAYIESKLTEKEFKTWESTRYNLSFTPKRDLPFEQKLEIIKEAYHLKEILNNSTAKLTHIRSVIESCESLDELLIKSNALNFINESNDEVIDIINAKYQTFNSDLM